MLPLWNKSRYSGQRVCRCVLSQPGVQRCIQTSLDKRWHRKVPSMHPLPVHIAFQPASFMRLTFDDFRSGRYYICHLNVFVYLCWVCRRRVTLYHNSWRWNVELETNERFFSYPKNSSPLIEPDGSFPCPLEQRFPNFFQVGTTFISQNVLRTTLLLSPLKANCLRFSTTVCDRQFTLILFFLSFLD
jgi:hypothetical protein